VKKSDGSLDTDSIEQLLGQIESEMNSLYEAIRGDRPLTPPEWASFCVFAGLMLVRVPRFLSAVDDFASKVFSASYQMLSRTDRFVHESEKRGVSKEALDQLDVKANRDFSLKQCLRAMETPAKIFSQMGWVFLKAPAGEHFITGDNPVSYLVPGRAKSPFPPGIADRDIEVTFPLSHNTCAVGAWKCPDKLYTEVTARDVHLTNVRTARAASRHLYGPQNDPNFFVPKPCEAG
jgi:hypothetical protein